MSNTNELISDFSTLLDDWDDHLDELYNLLDVSKSIGVSVNKETNNVLKNKIGPSVQETFFVRDKKWIRDTQIIPIINQIEGRIKFLKEGWSNSRFRTTGFNMDHPYLKLWELLITQKKEIEDFYNNIKMVENTEGKTYKIKD